MIKYYVNKVIYHLNSEEEIENTIELTEKEFKNILESMHNSSLTSPTGIRFILIKNKLKKLI